VKIQYRYYGGMPAGIQTYTTAEFDTIRLHTDEDGDISFWVEAACNCEEECGRNCCADDGCDCCGAGCECKGGDNDCESCKDNCECMIDAEECYEDHSEYISPNEATGGEHQVGYLHWGNLIEVRMVGHWSMAGVMQSTGGIE